METVKCLILILLVLQTSSMVLLLRYTRTVGSSHQHYLPSTVVLLAEVIKILSCVFVIFYQSNFSRKMLISTISECALGNPQDTMKMMVPAAVYAVQNNLLFVALSYLDAATYQVTYQLKILMTAIFSVIILKRTLTSQQWIALLLLTIGVALVQLPIAEAGSPVASSLSLNNRMFGLAILILSSASSGFAGVYFELLLKNSSTPFWIRNLQMAFFAFCFSALALYFNDGDFIAKQGFFQGYNMAVVFVLLLQAFGGLLVATVVRYTDNIIKGFATSLSIIVSSLMSRFMLQDLEPSLTFAAGTCIVLTATFLYGRKSSSSKKLA